MRMSKFLTLVSALAVILVLLPVQALESVPSCLDENGSPVDWFMAYKFPYMKNREYPFNTGYAYAYITSEMFGRTRLASQPNWNISDKLITDKHSIMLRTLSIAYDPDNSHINTLFYNDSPAGNLGKQEDGKYKYKNASRAHAKGFLIMDDDKNGLWVTHSFPSFPPPRGEELKFGDNIMKYGQTFACISYDIDKTGKQIVDHLINMDPLVYDRHINPELSQILPNIDELRLEVEMKYKQQKSQPTLSQTIKTRKGQKITLFSKSKYFNGDIYADFIEKIMKTSLYVETWRSGSGGRLNSSCPNNSFHVNNVLDLRYAADKNIRWAYSNDHSKWAISQDESPAIVCLCDSNRMQSQFKRGAGAFCIKCPNCWKVFSNTIYDTEPCPAPSTTPRPNNKKEIEK